MNFNFNFKDMPCAPEASIRSVTNPRDPHHTARIWIKRTAGGPPLRIVQGWDSRLQTVWDFDLSVPRAGGPGFGRFIVCSISDGGAPSLRFLQGRAAMLPTRSLSLCTKPIAHAFVVPALRKVREGRGTPFIAKANELKSLGRPPTRLSQTPTSSKARATRPLRSHPPQCHSRGAIR